jgi:hypothetical protein
MLNPPDRTATPVSDRDSASDSNHETAPTGAIRSRIYDKGKNGYPIRLDLILANDSAVRRLGETLGEGATKYGDHNWMKGFTQSSLLHHAIEHLRRYAAGDRTEDHLSHAEWNLRTLQWIEEHKPELLDSDDALFRAGQLDVEQLYCYYYPLVLKGTPVENTTNDTASKLGMTNLTCRFCKAIQPIPGLFKLTYCYNCGSLHPTNTP